MVEVLSEVEEAWAPYWVLSVATVSRTTKIAFSGSGSAHPNGTSRPSPTNTERTQRRNTEDESKAAASVLAMYGFARQPKWIAAHLLTLLLLTTFIWAGFWQFGRHQERGQRNEETEDTV